VAPHHQGAWAHPSPRRLVESPPRSSCPSRFPPMISSRCIIFAYITPRSTRYLYIMFSLCFCFELFLSGVDLSFESTMIASIGVVTSHDKFKKSACIRTGGGVPRHILAPRTSLLGNNPFHTLIHEHQFQKVPRSRLPSGWDIDHSNSVGKESSKSEEGWEITPRAGILWLTGS
jgi:hypothetical protein